MKDISLLGRDMSRTLIVDNLPINLLPQKDNAILIKPFYGDDKDDDALYYLGNILSDMYKENCNDIRVILSKYRQDIFKNVSSSLN